MGKGMDMRMLRTLAALVVAMCIWTTIGHAGPIENLQPGEWYQVPNSHLNQVGVKPDPPAPGFNSPDVMNPWSGGAYDTKRDRLIIWGGGHSDYSGNEIYAFDLNTLAWSRLTNPSSDVGGTEASGYYPDGMPRSRHTYDYIEYLGPTFDSFCSFGGHGLYPLGQTGIANTDCYSFTTNAWTRYTDNPELGAGGVSAIGMSSACDPVTGHAWSFPPGSNAQLEEFNPTPAPGTWTIRSDTGPGDVYYANAEIDPVRRRYMVFGNGLHASWQIDGVGDNLARTNLETTGATAIEAIPQIGMAYDSADDRMVAWAGGGDVYVLNLVTLVWTLVSPAPTNAVIPPAMDPNGTWGRFRYSAAKNCFVVVNNIDQDVYIYRLSGGAAPSVTDQLAPNRPNPFNPATRIPYTLASGGRVLIRVYDASGRLVRTVVNEEKPRGAYTATWSGESDHGTRAGSGTYFLRITYPDGTQAEQKLTVLK